MKVLKKKFPNNQKKDFLIIQGDWNAKVVKDATWNGCVGRFGTGSINERGQRLLEFAERHKLVIANTLHPHKDSRNTTWHSPNGLVHNQIDYILTPKRFKSSIIRSSTRTYLGADVNSDHDLVMCNLRLKRWSNKREKRKRIRYNVNKLKDQTISKAYSDHLDAQLSEIEKNMKDCDLTEICSDFEQALTSSASEIIGKYRSKKQPWITGDILDLCDKRRTLKSKRKLNAESEHKYREINSKIRKMMLKANEDWIQTQCKSIDIDIKHSRHNKRAYETLKMLTKTTPRSTSIIEDRNGVPLAKDTLKLNRWTEYCKELYNYPINPDPSVLAHNENHNTYIDDELPILESEVVNAIKTLKDGKSPGIDNIPSELIKHGGTAIIRMLTAICQKAWVSKSWPKQWTKSLIIPIAKKGNIKKCKNYRTLSLICHSSKILLTIILKRLNPQIERVLSEEQSGFRKGRSTVEQVFNCRNIIEKHLDSQKDLYHNFIDFKKAFDRVYHEWMWSALCKFGINNDIIMIIKSLYANSTSAVLLNYIYFF